MERHDAEENLRVIRSLMEKATIYRAISAPTALVGGLASMGFGLGLYFWWRPLPIEKVEQFSMAFLIGWAAVLVVTGGANTLYLWRDAKRRGDKFISPGMRLALNAIFPAVLVGGIVSAIFVFWRLTLFLPAVWILCYALGLLAAKPFAPRSIGRLGWCFLLAGCFAALYLIALQARWSSIFGEDEFHLPTAANLLMVSTFGLLHLIYAVCTWPRAKSSERVNP